MQGKNKKEDNKEEEDIKMKKVKNKHVKRKETKMRDSVMEEMELIREMRGKGDRAPVDVMGCHLHKCVSSSIDNQAFQVLVSLILAVQTKDEITHMIMQRLFQRYDNDMTILHINTIDPDELKTLIYEANFNNQKVKFLKAAAQQLVDNNQGRMYSRLEDLVTLKGVGNKIGILLMQTVYNKNVGIAVDTHVHKVANRLGWVATSTPELTRVKLETLLPP